ncbi:unnamed protein product [Ostreobium quekettii]|uniref:Uncharacterized protein n=1 Tax=Ostreobium quekettii TaxID=121088 RepID=A0A8S1J587_9CHLO|nr:unnamed protein product [Ostreobium quekettii]
MLLVVEWESDGLPDAPAVHVKAPQVGVRAWPGLGAVWVCSLGDGAFLLCPRAVKHGHGMWAVVAMVFRRHHWRCSRMFIHSLQADAGSQNGMLKPCSQACLAPGLCEVCIVKQPDRCTVAHGKLRQHIWQNPAGTVDLKNKIG